MTQQVAFDNPNIEAEKVVHQPHVKKMTSIEKWDKFKVNRAEIIEKYIYQKK